MELEFKNQNEAIDFSNIFNNTLHEKGVVTVADIRELGQPVFLVGDRRIGWTKDDMVSNHIRIRWNRGDSSTVILPDPKPLDESKKTPDIDMVNHPYGMPRRSGRYPWGSVDDHYQPHYQSNGGMEVINVIEAFTADLQGIEATDTGNIIKYICRWKHKNGIEDLKKARWYLDHLINKLEK